MLSMITLILAMAQLDETAISNCADLSHPSRELQVAIGPAGEALPVESVQRVVWRRVGRQKVPGIINTVTYPANAVALCHSHPAKGSAITPSPEDWAAAQERPQYISHNGRLIRLAGKEWALIFGELSKMEVLKINQSRK